MNRWRSLRLGEVSLKIGSGATPRGGSSVYLDSGNVALIRSQNIYNNSFSRDGLVFLSERHASELSNVEVQAGDILLNITGDSVARSCAVPSDVLPARVNQHVAIIRTDPQQLCSDFVRYWLVSPATQANLHQLAGAGATRNALTKGMIESLIVDAPCDLDEQRSIADILISLDDKIELNRRINETLEAMARALFKDWVIDLGPVRAKISTLIKDGVLEIGDGYRAKNSELSSPGLPFVRAGNLTSGFDTQGAEILNERSVAKAGNKCSQPGDVAFTSKGTIGRFARVSEFTDPFVYSPQVCFWRSLNPARLQPSILYSWMMSDDLKNQIDAVAGQTDMAPYVSLRDQRAMEIPIFPDTQLQLAEKLDALFRRQSLADLESRNLARMRDVLLPKLLSGELRVGDAEEEIAKVA